MLIKCPECELQVSDKAAACPHCGYPMKADTKTRKSRTKSNKRRRLPNGFGQISEIKNQNLRKPFRAMVSVGKTETGRPICKPLKPDSYFPTYNDAYTALVEYNRNPYDLKPSMTGKDLYEKWTEYYFQYVSESHKHAIKGAWKYCSTLYKMRVVDIRSRHIKGCMEDGVAISRGVEKTTTAIMKNKIKSMLNQMLDYAVEYELTDKNYARAFTLSEDTLKDLKTTKKEHISFSDDEINLLWEHVNEKRYVDMLLIQCYSGWRPRELCALERANVDLVNRTFVGGMKTEAGKARLVPIHPRIYDLVVNLYDEAEKLGSNYLFNYVDSERKHKAVNFNYPRYQLAFALIRNDLKLNPEHRPHDGRKHFVTAAKKYGVDEYAIKYMVGHKISDITEKVYTERELKWLHEEIEKIK